MDENLTYSSKEKTSGLYFKSFTIIIYYRNGSIILIKDHNEIAQYYKTMILSILA